MFDYTKKSKNKINKTKRKGGAGHTERTKKTNKAPPVTRDLPRKPPPRGQFVEPNQPEIELSTSPPKPPEQDVSHSGSTRYTRIQPTNKPKLTRHLPGSGLDRSPPRGKSVEDPIQPEITLSPKVPEPPKQVVNNAASTNQQVVNNAASNIADQGSNNGNNNDSVNESVRNPLIGSKLNGNDVSTRGVSGSDLGDNTPRTYTINGNENASLNGNQPGSVNEQQTNLFEGDILGIQKEEIELLEKISKNIEDINVKKNIEKIVDTLKKNKKNEKIMELISSFKSILYPPNSNV